MTNRITRNKAVYFIYQVTDEHGQLLEQSDIPIGYVHGSESGLLPKLEQSLENHVTGDRVEVVITPEEGFGPRDPDLVYSDAVSNVPEEIRFVGADAHFKNDQGEVRSFVVTHIDAGTITLDGNHPYAGRNVVFRVTVKEVRDAELDEISSGRPKNLPPSTVH